MRSCDQPTIDDKVADYHEFKARLEPGLAPHSVPARDMVLASIAVSLKRIADALDDPPLNRGVWRLVEAIDEIVSAVKKRST